jgi:hypothetical protein
MVHFRRATEADLSAIIALLGDDDLAKAREDFQPELPSPLALPSRSSKQTRTTNSGSVSSQVR